MSLPIYQRVAVTDAGDVIPGAEYTVINENTGVAAPIYSDRTGATLLTPPYFADSVGTIQFYISAGTTFRVAASGGVGTYTDRYIYAAHPQSSPTDPTANALMAVGAWGLGGLGLVATDANTALRPGFYCGPGASGVNYFNEASGQYGTLLVEVRQTLQIMQTNTFGNRSAKRESSDQGATWTGWVEIYTTANAVGTVAPDGSGSIIETGSNANGSYTKFADGTMICWRNSTIVSSLATTISRTGGGFRSSGPDQTLPASFVNANYTVTAQADGFFINTTNSAGASFFNFGIAAINSGTYTFVYRYIAVGRWF